MEGVSCIFLSGGSWWLVAWCTTARHVLAVAVCVTRSTWRTQDLSPGRTYLYLIRGRVLAGQMVHGGLGFRPCPCWLPFAWHTCWPGLAQLGPGLGRWHTCPRAPRKISTGRRRTNASCLSDHLMWSPRARIRIDPDAAPLHQRKHANPFPCCCRV